LIAARPGYVPREQWSASGLSHDRACRRSYALRYLEGRKEIELAWLEAEALPEPPKAPKNASALEKERAKAAKKAWNKKRRPACGKASHGIQEAYYRQGVAGLWHPPMAWLDMSEAFHTKPGEILLPGLALMPAPRECLDALIEDPIRLRWEFLPAHLREQVEADPITFSGFKDLVLVTAEGVLHWHAESDCYYVAPEFDPGDGLVADVTGVREHEQAARDRGERFWSISLKDLKTTYDFASKAVKSPEDLATDEQASLYALDVMQRFDLNRLECTWVYCRSEGKPDARAVTFTVLRSDAEEIVTALVERALELRKLMRACPQLSAADAAALKAALEKPAEKRCARELDLIQLSADVDEKRHLYVMSLPASPEACDDYGGRDCHASRGGPCDARLSYVAMIQRRMRAATATKGPRPMMTEEQKARLEELRAIPDRNFKQKRELADLERLDTAPAGECAAEETAEEKPEPAKETPAADAAPTKQKAPKAAPVKDLHSDVADHQGITITNGGIVFDLPKTSPLYKPLMAAAKAQRAFAAALAGES
jgi:hypothetical protein